MIDNLMTGSLATVCERLEKPCMLTNPVDFIVIIVRIVAAVVAVVTNGVKTFAPLVTLNHGIFGKRKPIFKRAPRLLFILSFTERCSNIAVFRAARSGRQKGVQ